MAKSVIEKDFNKYLEDIRKIDDYFRQQYKPGNFKTTDPKGILIQMDNAFEDVCFVLQQYGTQNPKKLSIYSFNKKLTLIEDKIKKQQEQAAKARAAQGRSK